MNIFMKTTFAGCMTVFMCNCHSPPDLNGTWESTSISMQGKMVKWNREPTSIMYFDNGYVKIGVLEDDLLSEGTYTVEANPNPKFSNLNIILTNAVPESYPFDTGPRIVRAIYTIEDDELTTCSKIFDPQTRPEEIVIDENHTVNKLKRSAK